MFNVDFELTDKMISGLAGLGAVGALLNSGRFDKNVCAPASLEVGGDISNSDVLRSYLGLLCVGKVSFASVEHYLDDEFFQVALGVEHLPSEETLRQRLDALACLGVIDDLPRFSAKMLNRHASPSPIAGTSLIPLDFDVTPLDNSGSKKEGVGYTYKGYDGYAPMMGYIGAEGFMLHQQLRYGSDHSNVLGTAAYLKQSISFARQICPNKSYLARLDSGNDSAENIELFDQVPDVNFIVKRNFRRSDTSAMAEEIMAGEDVKPDDKGKSTWLSSQQITLRVKVDGKNTKREVSCRMVVKVVQRTQDKDGSAMLFADVKVEGWLTDLKQTEFSDQTVISLYCDHATCEQFHGEFKTDLGIERLPSGKFPTNFLIMCLGQLAFNMLRIIGQNALKTGLMPGRKRDIRKRLRIRTVLQNIMYMACQYMIRNRKNLVKLAEHNIFSKIYMLLVQRIKQQSLV